MKLSKIDNPSSSPYYTFKSVPQSQFEKNSFLLLFNNNSPILLNNKSKKNSITVFKFNNDVFKLY